LIEIRSQPLRVQTEEPWMTFQYIVIPSGTRNLSQFSQARLADKPLLLQIQRGVQGRDRLNLEG
jgi:hypothetical protein